MKCEGRNEKCEFLAREGVSSSPIVRIFGMGKCKFIANFSATMVTSLPSLSVSLSVNISLSLSPKVPHAQYRKRFRASYNTCYSITITKLRTSVEKDTGSRGWFGGSIWTVSAGEEDSKTGTVKHVKSSVARSGDIVLRWSSGYGLDLIKAGETQTETSLLTQYVAGESVDLLDD